MPLLHITSLSTSPEIVQSNTPGVIYVLTVPAGAEMNEVVTDDQLAAAKPALERLRIVGKLLWDARYYGPEVAVPPVANASADVYTPTTPANWSPVPANVGAALDTLASAKGGLVRSATLAMSPGASSLVFPNVTVGQRVSSAVAINSTTGDLIDVTSFFEATISVAGHIQQIGAPTGTKSFAFIVVQ